VKEYEGNKAHASRLLGIERNFLRRMLRDWLPRPQHYLRLAGPEASEPRASETRLCADGLAKAAVPPTSTEKKRAQS